MAEDHGGVEGAGGGAGADRVPGPSCSGEPESSDSLRTFGAFVQGLREHAGLSREEFADLVRFSKHTIASIEQGRRMPDLSLVDRAEEVLGNTGALRKAAECLSRQPGLASWFRRWARLEAVALALYTYECRLIPGLLQTKAYAWALCDNQLPPMDDAKIEAKWALRAERQHLLTERANTAFSFIIEEHLFRRHAGGTAATREPIDHVPAVVELRNVEIQIMPLAREHAGMAGPMQLLETADNRWFAYCEGQESGQFITDPKVVSMLQMRYAGCAYRL